MHIYRGKNDSTYLGTRYNYFSTVLNVLFKKFSKNNNKRKTKSKEQKATNTPMKLAKIVISYCH